MSEHANDPLENVNITIEPTTDTSLPAYDYSSLSAYDMCPKWGVIRYGHGKTFKAVDRAMALDAGRAAHDGFAAIRLYQLGYYQALKDHAIHHAQRLFGNDRADTILRTVDGNSTHEVNLRNVALEALYTSGYYDDPNDRRRTVANIEAMLITYAGRWSLDRYPVYVRDRSDPTALVGVEIPFDVTVTFDFGDGRVWRVRYIGRIDGLHHNAELPELVTHENKTGARIDDVWAQSMQMTMQNTGYCIAAGALLDLPIHKGLAIGSQLPLPKMYSDGIRYEPFTKHPYHFERWFRWFFENTWDMEQWKSDPIKAPMKTHSCNRYFRPCPFIPLCYEDDEAQLHMLQNEMVIDKWSPLDEAGDK
jgi:hypothetical protein